MSMTQTLTIPTHTLADHTIRAKYGNMWWADPTTSVNVSHPVPVTKGIRAALKQTQCWYAKGPVLAAFLSIEKSFIDCLNDYDDLQEGERVCDLPYKFQACMVGRCPESARPCIAMFGSSQKVCQRTFEVIKSSSWWLKFEREYPGFRFIYLHGDEPPFRMGGLQAVDDIMNPDTVYVENGIASLYNIPILFKGPVGKGYQAATLGGIVFLDAEPYGLTVAHCLEFRDRELSVSLNSGSDEGEPFFCFLDEDCSESERETDTGPASESASSSLSARDNAQQASSEPDFDDISFQDPTAITTRKYVDLHAEVEILGRVIHASSGLSDDMFDWALVKIEPRWAELLRNQMENTDIPTGALSHLGIDNIPALPVPSVIRNNRRSIGERSVRPTYIRLPEARKMMKVYEVVFPDVNLDYGDCGRWVYDDDTHTLIGHIIAGCPGSSVAYISRIIDVEEQVKVATGQTLQLPSEIFDQEAHLAADSTSTIDCIVHCLKEPLGSIHRLWHDSIIESSLRPKGWRYKDDKAIQDALVSAAKTGLIATVRRLLRRGVDPNHPDGQSETALQGAIEGGYLNVVKLLLEAGVDIEAQGFYGTALQTAAFHGNTESVKLLLEHGANANAQGGWFGPALQISAQYGNTELVKLLLEHGADVHAQGGEYGTALQAAASWGDVELVQMLLDCGADINAHSGRYGSALMVAKQLQRDKVVDLLLAAGAVDDSVRDTSHNKKLIEYMLSRKLVIEDT